MFSKTRRTQIVSYRDLNFSRLLSFVYFLEMLPPNWVTFLRVRGSREYRPPCINLFPSYSFLMSPRFILWFGERKRERERERESQKMLTFCKKWHSYESTQVINIFFLFLEVNFLQKSRKILHEKGLKKHLSPSLGKIKPTTSNYHPSREKRKKTCAKIASPSLIHRP